MRKTVRYIFVIPLLLLAASLAGPLQDTAFAQRGGGHGGQAMGRGAGGPRGSYGGGHYGGGRYGGGHYGGGYYRGGGYWGHGGHYRGGVWFGSPWYWDPFWYPFYPYYAYPYSSPTVIIEKQQPEEYIMSTPQPEQQQYWYYCKEANGYYPYVKRCPGGWVRVVPTPPPDQSPN